MSQAGPSLAFRAVLAVALMAGFYLFALAVAAFLVFIPYAEWQYADRLHAKIAFFCLAGAFIILKSILPRPDRFVPPGPELPAVSQPRLFALVDRIAESTGQERPHEVYLVPDVNAWVAQRGGLMGFGSRAVMGLGLPLLQCLTVSQLHAVLAHEFGHFHGGDTRLGPWIYKTRGAIGRTLEGLADSILQWPFRLYASLFLRITHAVSREQELAADRLAARVAGAAPLAEGLRATHGAALAFPPYWAQEIAPVLQSGFVPPLAEGFRQFVATPAVAQALAESVEKEERAGLSDPYDTHPSLRDRVKALASLHPGPARRNDAPALSLLDGVPELEHALLAHAAGPSSRLRPVSWDEVGPQVYVPQWRALLAERGAAFEDVTVGGLGELLGKVDSFGQALLKQEERSATAEQRQSLASFASSAAVSIALFDAGFSLDARPGVPVSLSRGDVRVEPFNWVSELARGTLGAGEWTVRCDAAGITSLPLRSRPHAD